MSNSDGYVPGNSNGEDEDDLNETEEQVVREFSNLEQGVDSTLSEVVILLSSDTFDDICRCDAVQIDAVKATNSNHPISTTKNDFPEDYILLQGSGSGSADFICCDKTDEDLSRKTKTITTPYSSSGKSITNAVNTVKVNGTTSTSPVLHVKPRALLLRDVEKKIGSELFMSCYSFFEVFQVLGTTLSCASGTRLNVIRKWSWYDKNGCSLEL